jgi:hypothetical protein
MNVFAGSESARLEFCFDASVLEPMAEALGPSYRGASPFPHIAMDDFLPPGVIAEAASVFPGADAPLWFRAERKWETKRSCENESAFPPAIRKLLHEFNSSTFVSFLETLTGIRGLIPDPHFRGGGLHSISPGGRLGIHADFNYYERLQLHRRLNLLLYLNDDWHDEYGGKLELWDREMGRCVAAYAPLFNRCIVFSTTDDSFHGHPEPLKCPSSRSRNSLALYYYTASRPEEEISSPHSTVFRQRPGSRDVPATSKLGIFARISRRLRR